MDSGNVVGKDGKVSTSLLANRLKQIFKAEYGANDRFGTFSPEMMGAAGPEMAKLFDTVKALNRFPRFLSDSGTSQRIKIGEMIENPGTALPGALGRMMLPKWIEQAQVDPQILAELLEEMRSMQNASF
jgi:hypothetical protein